ncbi:MAG: transglutaminase family protein, partial [Pseudomonadota bacterium]|nr:transglutaminase family protein [Pseudomonadota bacterium]
MTRYAVRHATVYEYGGNVSHSHHLLHLKPREFAFQRCLEHSLELDPPPSSAREDLDAFGNAIARLEYDRSHERLAVIAQM